MSRTACKAIWNLQIAWKTSVYESNSSWLCRHIWSISRGFARLGVNILLDETSEKVHCMLSVYLCLCVPEVSLYPCLFVFSKGLKDPVLVIFLFLILSQDIYGGVAVWQKGCGKDINSSLEALLHRIMGCDSPCLCLIVLKLYMIMSSYDYLYYIIYKRPLSSFHFPLCSLQGTHKCCLPTSQILK